PIVIIVAPDHTPATAESWPAVAPRATPSPAKTAPCAAPPLNECDAGRRAVEKCGGASNSRFRDGIGQCFDWRVRRSDRTGGRRLHEREAEQHRGDIQELP